MDPLDIIESTAEPAFATDESGRVVIWNPAVQKLLGYRPEEVLGKPCHDVTCGRDPFGNRFCDSNCNILGMVLRKESINRFPLTMRRANGQDLAIWITIISVPGPKPSQHTLIHILAAGNDVIPVPGANRAGVSSTGQSPPPTIAPPIVAGEEPTTELTARELEVLTLMAEGTSTSNVADSLFISISTVRSHTQNILNKLDAHSKLEAVAVALRKRLI